MFTFLLFFSVSSFRCSLRVLGCRRPPLMSEQMIGRLVPPIRDAFPHVVKHKNQKSREKSHSSNRQRAHLQIIPRRLCHQYTILLLKNDSEMCLSNMFSVQFEDAISGGYFMAFFAIMMTCKHNFGILMWWKMWLGNVPKHKNQKSREKSHLSNRQRAHLQIIPRRRCHQYTILLLRTLTFV